MVELAQQIEEHSMIKMVGYDMAKNAASKPSGGLRSKGHPLGSTCLAQCTELVWQLRGQGEQRQVEGAKVASSTTSVSAAPAS